MKRVFRLSNAATAFLLIALGANVAGSGSESDKPQLVTSLLTAIDDACNAKGSILAVTPNRTCVIVKVAEKSRTLKDGKAYPFSRINANMELDCKGYWDETTSPPMFRAVEISVGRRLTKDQVMGKSKATALSVRPTVRTAPPKPQVELIDCKFENSKALSRVTGKVRNISNSPIKNMVAVVRYLTPEGRFVLMDTNTVSTANLRPGDSATFRIETRWDPEFSPTIGKSKVEFHVGKGNLVVKQPK